LFFLRFITLIRPNGNYLPFENQFDIKMSPKTVQNAKKGHF